MTNSLIDRYFTHPETHPYDEIRWAQRDALIAASDGKVIFEQRGVEFPESWSQNAVNIVASKYFRGLIDDPSQRENSVKQMVERVASQITEWAVADRLAEQGDESLTLYSELTYILVNQLACFNSPVWFNVGVEEKPQCSACFILNIDDSIEGILKWYDTEGKIFKGGSGSGINLSTLRSSKERVSAGGYASGPVSFMRGADAIAGTIKSGGKTRRAAKMVILNVDHPDVEEFIWCKAREEDKVRAMAGAGFDVSLNSDIWNSVQYQNANNSVRVTDEFMNAVEEDRQFDLNNVNDGNVQSTVKARDLFEQMCQAAWRCADPGIQYQSEIDKWHTCPNTGPITATNPCSEYVHLDNSACNLASINLMKFVDDDGNFMIDDFKQTVRVMITAMDAIVHNSSYPTQKIANNAKRFRQLGLGYTNLGAVLMQAGVGYDSDEGRSLAALITSLMTGEAYAQSVRLAERVGPFDGFAENREPMVLVIDRHLQSHYDLNQDTDKKLWDAGDDAWCFAFNHGKEHGYRNSQATVIAPTGTISFMMDADTTGIEPDLALVKYKTLVGGGVVKIVNQQVGAALYQLGYTDEQVKNIVKYVNDNDTIEGAPDLHQSDLHVFDCAFKPENGERSLHWKAHVKMMSAVQPFVSGAISKTVNLPSDATVDDVKDAYMMGYTSHLKALAIYRDGSKNVQPMTAKREAPVGRPYRQRLPDTRESVTHKFSIAGHEGYLTVGLFDDGKPGEIFITMSKEGSTLSGMMDSFATMVSISLQYGVPLTDLVRKFSRTRFEPFGMTGNPELPMAQSIIDYIFRWLRLKFLPDTIFPGEELVVTSETKYEPGYAPAAMLADGPPCPECGTLMTTRGGCDTCDNCGTTGGCG